MNILANKATYQQWNGKNINGNAELNNDFLSTEAYQNNTTEMKCIVGVDTFSAYELQNQV